MENETAPPSEEVGIISYRRLSQGFCLSFYVTLIGGFFITFYSSDSQFDYSTTDKMKDSDLVYRVFGSFNPCMLFDHYPSNVFSMIGISVMVCFQVASVLFVFIHSLTTGVGGLATVIFHSSCLGVMLILLLCFANVFNVNLYHDHGYQARAKVASNATKDDRDGVTEGIMATVALHTLWFILYTVADIMSSVFFWRHVFLIDNTPWAVPPSTGFFSRRWWRVYGRRIVAAAYFYSYTVFCTSMTLATFANDSNDRFSYFYRPDNFVQQLMVGLNNYTAPYLWFFLPATLQHFVMENGVGLRWTVRLSPPAKGAPDVEKNHAPSANALRNFSSEFRPCQLFSLAAFIFAFLNYIISSFVADDDFNQQPNASSARSTFIIANALRNHDSAWRFIFVPLWTIVVATVGVACFFTWCRCRLAGQSRVRTSCVACSGTVLTFSMFLCTLVVIPQLENQIVPVIFLISLPVWVLSVFAEVQCTGTERARVAVYTLLLISFGLLARYFLWANALFVVVLVAYGVILPSQDHSAVVLYVQPCTKPTEEETLRAQNDTRIVQ